jgi:hypothetical protein
VVVQPRAFSMDRFAPPIGGDACPSSASSCSLPTNHINELEQLRGSAGVIELHGNDALYPAGSSQPPRIRKCFELVSDSGTEPRLVRADILGSLNRCQNRVGTPATSTPT